MPGLFITFEGTEGAGKSTQLELLSSRIQKTGREVVELREPGGTECGEEIRRLLKHGPETLTAEAELLLMNASRAQLVREVIRPALSRNAVVLCDRFYDSTTAYQGHGRQINLELVDAVITAAVGDTRPDLTLYLRINPATSRQRMGDRGGTDRFETQNEEFFRRVEGGFDTITAAEPDRFFPVNSENPIDQTAIDIWNIVSPKL